MVYLETIYNIELRSSEVAMTQIALENMLDKKKEALKEENDPFGREGIKNDIRKINIIKGKFQKEIN